MIKPLVKRFLNKFGYNIESIHLHDYNNQENFIPIEQTLREAARAGLSVGDYIDSVMSHNPGATQLTVDGMQRLGVFDQTIDTICEIGPGRYLEKIIKIANPRHYEIYETALPWASYLVQNFDVVSQPTDSWALSKTESQSIDLVHAHKVFSSIDFLNTCCYWKEIVRVTRSGGCCVFDIMTDPCLDPGTIDQWVETRAGAGSYPAATPRAAAIEYFVSYNFALAGSYIVPLGIGKTEVFVFRKN
jgi:hypothetical protein